MCSRAARRVRDRGVAWCFVVTFDDRGFMTKPHASGHANGRPRSPFNALPPVRGLLKHDAAPKVSGVGGNASPSSPSPRGYDTTSHLRVPRRGPLERDSPYPPIRPVAILPSHRAPPSRRGPSGSGLRWRLLVESPGPVPNVRCPHGHTSLKSMSLSQDGPPNHLSPRVPLRVRGIAP